MLLGLIKFEGKCFLNDAYIYFFSDDEASVFRAVAFSVPNYTLLFCQVGMSGHEVDPQNIFKIIVAV